VTKNDGLKRIPTVLDIIYGKFLINHIEMKEILVMYRILFIILIENIKVIYLEDLFKRF